MDVPQSKSFIKRVFVIMPFTNANSRNAHQLGHFFDAELKSRLERHNFENFGLSVFRSANKFRITEEIIKDLRSADYVIAGLSGRVSSALSTTNVR